MPCMLTHNYVKCMYEKIVYVEFLMSLKISNLISTVS